jgi:hypothetical protein
MEHGSLFGYIKEMMLECHSLDPLYNGKFIPGECFDLVNSLRRRGIRCHLWT